MNASNQTVDGAISTAIRKRLGTAPLGTAHAVREVLAEAGFEIVPKVDGLPDHAIFNVRFGWPGFWPFSLTLPKGSDVATVTRVAKANVRGGRDHSRWVAFDWTQRRFLAPDEQAPSAFIVGPYDELVREVRPSEFPKALSDEDLKRAEMRWEIGLRNIVTILRGPRHEFEIGTIVEEVRALRNIGTPITHDVVRDAYRIGYERATYESGGDPSAVDLEGSAYLWARAHDLSVHLGDGDVHECFEAFIGSQSQEPAAVEDENYEITAEGAAIIRELVEQVPLTQEAVTAMGDALDRDVDANPDRYLRNVSGRDHAVGSQALAVRDVVEAHRLLGLAVATLGHEAVDTMMRAMPASILGAAA